MYSKQEVYISTLQYFKGDELATNKWIEKYCLKNQKGELLELNPGYMHHRMAKEFARIENKYANPLTYDQIFDVIKYFKHLIPQGSPMYGIGNDHSFTSLSNCFVIGSNNDSDSYGSIMRTDEEQVQLMKRRGGVGHDMSHLRPSGSVANNSVLGAMAGMPLFMERYSNSTREVAQDGRRGALMLSVDVRHPDTDKFIDMKLQQGKVTGANISVKLTDEFMRAVEKDEDFIQKFPITLGYNDTKEFYDSLEYNKLTQSQIFPNQYWKRIKARYLWNKVVQNAWQSAEPGILFWDKIISESPADCYGKDWVTVSTNPCGEIPLCPYDSCRLLAINLYSYVNNPFQSNASFDFKLFAYHIYIAQKIMDDLVDLEIEKIKRIINKIKSDKEDQDVKNVEEKVWWKILEKAEDGRRTGLGVTAEGDMLAAMGLRYGSEEATNFAVEVHKMLAIESYKTSIDLATERGQFPIWDSQKEIGGEHPFIDRIFNELSQEYRQKFMMYGRRNISNLTIAPTGTTSLMSQTTSGIEPLFRPFYKRRTKTEDLSKVKFIDEVGDKWEEYFVIHPKFKVWYDLNWFKLDSKLFDIDFHKPIEDYDEEGLNRLFEKSPYYKATANDIDWVSSVKMQGRIQEWIDHSISKTVNIPKETTVETVSEIYMAAWKEGCKGVTIYRDGSRSGVLIDSKETNREEFTYTDSHRRPKVTQCDIYHKTALKQNWTVLIGKVDGKPYEIFVIKEVSDKVFPIDIKNGTLTKVKSRTYKLEGIHNNKSFSIENIVPLMTDDEAVDTRMYSAMLRHRIDPKFICREIDEYATIVSFDKVVQRVLKNYVIEKEEDRIKCPVCGSTNYYSEEGCWKCPDCNFSKCG